MKGFTRTNLLFSLCGLNCGLCPMRLDGYCPGCGGGEGNQSCAIAKCSLEHGKPEYCSECGSFPCERYEKPDEFDSFITHRNRLKDLVKARDIGVGAYTGEQAQKVELLRYFLAHCNDGRRKTFFCTAVNLLELQDLQSAITQMESSPNFSSLSVKEKAVKAVQLLKEAAERRNIPLKLHKKPPKKK